MVIALVLLSLSSHVFGAAPSSWVTTGCTDPVQIDRSNICLGDQLNFGSIDTATLVSGTLTIPTSASTFPYAIIDPTTSNLGTVSVPISAGLNKDYTITEIIIRVGSDHQFLNQDLGIVPYIRYEMEVYMTPSDGSGNDAAMAWQIGIGDNIQRPGYSSTLLKDLISSGVSGGTATISSISLGNYLNTWLVPNPNFSRNTRFFMYTGTRTYQNPVGTCQALNWYVFDLPILVPQTDSDNFLTNVFQGTTTGYNFSGTANTATSTITATGCWPSYFFQNQTRHNTGFWAAIAFVLFYFIMALYSEKDLVIVDERFKHNVWTLFPVYSIWNTGGDYFTKNARLCIWWCSIGSQMCFQAVFFSNLQADAVMPTKGGIIVYSTMAMFASWPLNYVIGHIFLYVQHLQKEKFVDLKKGEIDVQINTAWFLFYFPAYVGLAFAVVITAWQGKYLNTVDGAWWLLSLLIGYGLDMVADAAVVLCARLIPCTLWWWKRRGFWFDYSLYQAVKKYEHLD